MKLSACCRRDSKYVKEAPEKRKFFERFYLLTIRRRQQEERLSKHKNFPEGMKMAFHKENEQDVIAFRRCSIKKYQGRKFSSLIDLQNEDGEKTSYTEQDYHNAYKNLMKIKLLRQEKDLERAECIEHSEFDDKLSRVTKVLKKQHLSHRNVFGSTSLSNVRFNI
ncbi:Oidioi.mRNA.OKI2018_I69.chr2.g6047.t1.cds [Oikopleura dioica]|uniref:Oidioi.mRNA.OKI2018_I69.chr2.g6047.t1.cds n=1 Tax=Oikopleura dioica TaxID=34765 RepID=A0ABN7TB82_OIKDI|nr:Oidioi.mRNA.OKI2018_I69.chr2.g6047.t1.cds [Oikopleura dioica]